MRIAIVSDVHGNLAALEAVVADLERQAPDLVLHGGDLALTGPHPAEVVDRIRELGWAGVAGNTDELLWRREVRLEQEAAAPGLKAWLDVMFDTLAPWARELLGEERIAWLRGLPPELTREELLLVHASPGDLWRAPLPDAPDEELLRTYRRPGVREAVYGHIHRPFVRALGAMTVANSGSAGLPFDGDPRPSYLLVEDETLEVRRVDHDLEPELRALAASGFPLPDWLAEVRRRGSFARP